MTIAELAGKLSACAETVPAAELQAAQNVLDGTRTGAYSLLGTAMGSEAVYGAIQAASDAIAMAVAATEQVRVAIAEAAAYHQAGA